VGDAYEAEELAQEAFTRAYVHLDDFAGERRFYPWVSVIASRLCVDTHRRRARSQPTDDIDPGVVDGGQEAVLQEADLAVLDQAFSQIAPRHREVLNLRERHGYSYQRIAEHYEVSLGTVEALLWRARRALRREFLNITRGEVPAVALVPAGIGLTRLARWRTRFLAWLHGNSLPMAAAVTALVVAGTTGAIFGGGGSHPSTAVHAAHGAIYASAPDARSEPPVAAATAAASTIARVRTTVAHTGHGAAPRAALIAVGADGHGVHASTSINRTQAEANPGLLMTDAVKAIHRYLQQLSLTAGSGQ
jgi:RNA polymerase sigma-70 factor (ECF subfamily)